MVAPRYGIGPTESGIEDVNWSEIFKRRLQQQKLALMKASRMTDPGGANALATGGAGHMGASPTRATPTVDQVATSIRPSAAMGNAAVGPNGVTEISAASAANNGSGGTGGSATGDQVTGDPAQRFPSDTSYNTGAGFGGPVKPNADWYTGRYTEATQEQLAEDPNRWANAWAMANGYGQGVTNLLNQYVDPAAAFLLSLGSGADPNNSDAKLAYAGGVNDFALQKSNGVADWEGPQEIIGAILGGSGTNEDNTPLGRMLYGGANNGNWGGQVKDTLAFMQQALLGRMAPEVMQPYLQNLQQYGDRFIEYKAMNPTDTRNFGAWLLDTLGPNGGL